MAPPHLEELLARNAVALFSRAASHPSGLYLVTGQGGSGKLSTALAMGRYLERRGAVVTYMAEERTLEELWGTKPPDSWKFLAGGRSEDDWRRAFATFPTGTSNVVVVDELTLGNTRPMFEAATRFRIMTVADTPLFGVDVAYSLRGWRIDMAAEIPPLRLLCSQVLLPRLCRECRKPVTLDPAIATEFNAGVAGSIEGWMEAGCETCSGSGTKGRVAAHEIVVLDESTRDIVRRAIRDNDAAHLPASHHLSLPEVARELLLAGEIGVDTYRQEIARNPLLRAERLLARERDLSRRTRDLFRRFVDDAVIDQFIAAPDLGTALEGRRVEATCLFCDIRGFTSFAEKHDPREVFRVLNELIDEIIAIVIRHGGMVDKIIGDSVMALFGLPVYQNGHAAAAVACAREIQARIAAMGRENPQRAALKVGIGINSGDLAAGCLGNSQRMDYTVLGDVVNTAARLEARAAPGQVLLGPQTRALIGDAVELRDLGDASLKGKSEAVRVYELA
jgi:class 3 adenylate cyclase